MTGSAQAEPGDHIRVGDAEITPDIDLGAEYRTNVYRDADAAVPAANLRIAPGLGIGAEGDDHEFKFAGEWELRKFFFVSDGNLPATGPSIDNAERIGNLDRFNEFSVSASADTFKRNVIGFRLSDTMGLKNWTADAEFAEVPYSSQFQNQLAGGLRINPGPALEFVPGLVWTYDAFLVPAAVGERALNKRNAYGPRLDAKWAFLPRTALVFQASWLHNDWQANTLDSVAGQELGAQVALPNSNHIQVLGGIDGRFTEKIFAQFYAGYGVGLYNEGAIAALEDPTALAADATGLTGLLIKAQLKYAITESKDDQPGSTVSVGYIKDFRDSFFTNFVALNSIFAEAKGRFGDFQPSARYELRFEDYAGEVNRNDIVNKFAVDGRYYASDWASFGGGLWWQQRASNSNAVEFDDFNLHALATFLY